MRFEATKYKSNDRTAIQNLPRRCHKLSRAGLTTNMSQLRYSRRFAINSILLCTLSPELKDIVVKYFVVEYVVRRNVHHIPCRPAFFRCILSRDDTCCRRTLLFSTEI